MKKPARKLMSLLMAFAIICSMVPAAMAASWSDYYYYGNYYDYYGYQSVGVQSGSNTTINANFPQYIMTSLGYAQLGDIKWNGGGNDITVSGNGTSAQVSAAYGSSNYTSTTATATAYYYLVNYPYAGVADTATFTYNITVGGTTSDPVTSGSGSVVPDYDYGSGSVGGTTSYVTSMSQGSMSLSVNGNGSLTVNPYYTNTSNRQVSIDSVTWSSSNPSVAYVSGYGSSATVTGVSSGQTTIYATVTGTYYTSYSGWENFTNVLGCTITVGTGYGYGNGTDTGHFYISPGTLQLQPSGDYALLTATPYYTSSVTTAQLANLTWYSSNPSVATVDYYGTNSATGSSAYIYGVSAGQATIYAYLDNGTMYATCEVTVGGGNDVDVLYTLTQGQSQALDEADFETFWSSNTSAWSTLNSVVFGTPTGNVGRLVYTATGNSQTSATGKTFYVNPTYSQYGIDDVVFVPNSASNRYYTGTLVVPFTAYGYTSDYYTSATPLSGNLYIVVTDGSVASIDYGFASTGTTLSGSDFLEVYRQEVSAATANSTVYIQFLDVPTFGDLYYGYNSSIYTSSYGTKLSSSNIGSLRFSSRANTSYSINDLTYIPGNYNGSDTIRYAAYNTASGGTMLYVGEVTFNRGEVTSIKYYGALNQTVTFDSDDFDVTQDLYYSDYITFGTPSSGTLYRDYAKGTGTRVTSGTAFNLSSSGYYSLPSVEDITFVPAANFSGVVEIPFTASATYGTQTSGVVKIYIAKKFSDVSTTSWAYEHITQLTAEGIVDGNSDGTFAPTRNLSYGEALKLIMEAAGYSESLATSGHWASNYLTRAYRDGLVSSTTLNLDSTITRNEVAAIAAKALSLSKAGSITGSVKPVDSTDGYVYALYNAGILTGTNEGGKNYFNGSDTLTREQVCAIVCRISEYEK